MNYQIEKQFKGEKYIYLLMAFNLCKEKGEIRNGHKTVKVGNDNNYIGGFMFERHFYIMDTDKGYYVLVEMKTKSNNASYNRYFKVMKSASLTPTIQELIENGDNLSRRWEH